jgi:hypothetical protein
MGEERETVGEDDMSQLKQEDRAHETMSSRDSEGEMHSMDSGFESALNSQKSFADSDTDGTLLSASTCIAGSALSSNARLSDNSENERGSLPDCAESGKSGTPDSQQSRKVLGEMRKDVRSALRSRVKAVGLTAEDAVEGLSSHRATSSTQDSKRLGCVTSPVDCSIQASGAMSKLLLGLFEDLNEGRKSLSERAAKRDIEVTQSILDDISRLNCGRGRDKAEVRFLIGSRSPSKVFPSAEANLEYDMEYYTGDRDRSGGRSGAGTETEEEDSCPLAYPPLSPFQISPVSSNLTSVVQRCVKRRGANICQNETNNTSQHTLEGQAHTMYFKMKSCNMVPLTTSPLQGGRTGVRDSSQRDGDKVASNIWEEER